MLVLSRDVSDQIMIGEDVILTVVAIKGHKVRIGVDAPKHVAVHRGEVYEAIQRKNRDETPGPA